MNLSCGCNNHYSELDRLDTPVARKQYKCEECYKQIEVGDLYAKYTQLYDGAWCETKVCESCYDLGESMAAMGFCWIFGELKELHNEYIDEYNPPKLNLHGASK